MKIAVTGKGGVGKTTLSATLSHLFVKDGRRVIAVDADPDANLAQALGVSEAEMEKIRPIADMPDLIEERTGARPGGLGAMFKLNPRVDDLPEGVGYTINGITLMVMGKSKSASSGCYCPENILLKRLLKHLFVERDEVVVVDMEAGIEHLTRGTAEAVDAFIVVVEPGQRSTQTAKTIREMATGLGVKNVFVVANKVRNDSDRAFLKEHLAGMEILGYIGFTPSVMDADLSGRPPFDRSPEVVDAVAEIKKRIEGHLLSEQG
ncbi:MAG: AAA family ATPase [Nitrospirales bacterium]|nr:AAA family ATPase [Nitrospirales bacterium]